MSACRRVSRSCDIPRLSFLCWSDVLNTVRMSDLFRLPSRQPPGRVSLGEAPYSHAGQCQPTPEPSIGATARGVQARLTCGAPGPMVTAVRGSEAIARILQREGTEFLFCFPAHGVIDACAALGVRPIITRTERTLVNMADGYTRVNDAKRLGVCPGQGGPGAEEAVGGVAQAASDSIPILLLPRRARRDRRGRPY